MLGAINGFSVQDREDLCSLEHIVLGHFAHRSFRCRRCEVGYDVWYWYLVRYIMYMQFWWNFLTDAESLRQQYGFG